MSVKELYYDDGQLMLETPFVDGKAHGAERFYRRDGQLKLETPYIKGAPHGIRRFWEKSGQVRSETAYVRGGLITDIPPGALYPFDEEPI